LENQKKSKKILGRASLDSLLIKRSELINVANSFLLQLYNFVKESDFIVVLTDEEGCILCVFGNEDMLGKASKNALVPGAYMAEEHIGTNGMGTALYEGKPLQVSGEEHYVQIFHQWTCSGAPIRDYEGKIIGCLDLTGRKELVNSHTLGMVAAAANAIEGMLKLKRYANKAAMNNQYVESILNSLPSAIFTTNFQGDVKLANRYIEPILGYTEAEFKKINISKLLNNWKSIISRINRNENIVQEDMYMDLVVNKIEVNLSAYPISNPYKEILEIVFVIKDVKKMRKLASRVIGSKAVYTFDKVIGRDVNFLKTVKFARKMADSKSTILITGESGTGKEIFAQSIHNLSNRREESFVALNCGAIPKNLIESELFGYVEGAFTGAKLGGQIGKFEIADGGTLFLDEIGEMPYELQIRLLRVIEEGVIRRVGGTDEIPIDVRIIAATNKNLKEEMEKGNFRKDLYYRLNVLPIKLPPLRERRTDIPLLIEYFMERKSKKLNRKMVHLTEEQIETLIAYDWPGNVRELENFVELAVNTEGIPISISGRVDSTGASERCFKDLTLEEMETLHIKDVLRQHDGNISHTASVLGIGRNTLYRKIEKYGIGVKK
jgi:PAS domain S-box-containing protein